MVTSVVEKWETMRDELLGQLAGSEHIECLIPGWEPVDMSTGLRWLQATIFEAFYVAYQIDELADRKRVQFKAWEFGQAEPPWPNS